MTRSPLMTRLAVALCAIGVLTMLRYKPWQNAGAAPERAAEKLTVGYLPVT